jgi:hypothetical protein
MKRILMLLAAAFAAGVVAFCVTRSRQMAADHRAVALDSMPELVWLRTELKLTDDQFAKVSALHAAYRPTCEEMCQRIAAARAKVEAAAHGSRIMTSELESAIREHADTHAACQRAMLEHLYETAALLDEEQSTRYLAAMLPFALEQSHAGSSPQHFR